MCVCAEGSSAACSDTSVKKCLQEEASRLESKVQVSSSCFSSLKDASDVNSTEVEDKQLLLLMNKQELGPGPCRASAAVDSRHCCYKSRKWGKFLLRSCKWPPC